MTGTARQAVWAGRRSAPCTPANPPSSAPAPYRRGWEEFPLRLLRWAPRRLTRPQPSPRRPARRRMTVIPGQRGGGGCCRPSSRSRRSILGGIGVVIGMLAQNRSGQARRITTAGARERPAPLVTGPDQSSLHQSCDQGFSMPTSGGFGTHAGRGTPETSCFFTDSVLRSYWAALRRREPAAPVGVGAGRRRLRPVCPARYATALTSSCSASSTRATTGSPAPEGRARASTCGECATHALIARIRRRAAPRCGRPASWPSR